MTFAVAFAVTTKPIAVAVDAPAAGKFQGTILDVNHDIVQQQANDTPVFNFAGVPAGSFVGTVCRLDANGDVIPGSVVSSSFTLADVVTAPPVDTPPVDTPPAPPSYVTVDVPSALSVSATPE